MRINAQLADFNRYIELRFFDEDNETIFAAKPLEMVAVERFAYCEPTVRVQKTAAQELMDSLWQCGLRPSEGSGSAGALAATQRHLDDMRALVFKTGKPAK